MAVVMFDPAEWREAYPQFNGLLTDAQLNQAFGIACLMLDNTDASPVPYDPTNGVETRKVLLWLLVCHLAALALRPVNQSGPMTNASEGSVSVGFQVPSSLNGQYFNQTPCGSSFWQAIRKYVVGGRYYDTIHYHPWG